MRVGLRHGKQRAGEVRKKNKKTKGRVTGSLSIRVPFFPPPPHHHSRDSVASQKHLPIPVKQLLTQKITRHSLPPGNKASTADLSCPRASLLQALLPRLDRRRLPVGLLRRHHHHLLPRVGGPRLHRALLPLRDGQVTRRGAEHQQSLVRHRGRLRAWTRKRGRQVRERGPCEDRLKRGGPSFLWGQGMGDGVRRGKGRSYGGGSRQFRVGACKAQSGQP